MAQPRFITEAEVEGGLIPSGGTTNQVLAKNSGTDYDLKWATGGGGGATIEITTELIEGDGAGNGVASGVSATTGASGLIISSADVESANVFIGPLAGSSVTDGTENTGIGTHALQALTDGGDNVCVGLDAGVSLTGGSSNVLVGQDAGSGLETGEDNTFIGTGAGASADEDAEQCVAVGSDAQANGVNSIAIGYGVSVSDDNSCQIGNQDLVNFVFGDNSINFASGVITAASISLSTLVSLTPSADPPGAPTEGMIYADTDHHLYFFNGTDWKQLDNA